VYPGVEEILQSRKIQETHGGSNKNLELLCLRVQKPVIYFRVKNWISLVRPMRATKSKCSWISLEDGERKTRTTSVRIVEDCALSILSSDKLI